MAVSPPSKTVMFAAAAAVIFGVATVAAGGRVLLGADPGYTVFRPLLLFNTAMGFAYIVVGFLAWQRIGLGVRGAALIAFLNLTVLAGIAVLHAADAPIATTSLQAMAFRASAWVVLFLVLLRASRQPHSGGRDVA